MSKGKKRKGTSYCLQIRASAIQLGGEKGEIKNVNRMKEERMIEG